MAEYVPVEELGVFEALPRQFSKHFSPIIKNRYTEKNKSLDITWVSSSDIWRQIVEGQKQQENGKLDFPFCYFKLMSINTHTASDQLNHMTKNLYRSGLIGKYNESGVAYIHRFIPADFLVEVTFITDNFSEVKAFANKWQYVAIGQRLNSNWTYDGITLSVRVDMEYGVNIPEQDATAEIPNYYEVKANLTVRGFMSEGNLLNEREKTVRLQQIIVKPIYVPPNATDLNIIYESNALGNTKPLYIPKKPDAKTKEELEEIEQFILQVTDDGDIVLLNEYQNENDGGNEP